MQKSLAIFLIFALLSSSFGRFLVYAGFTVNKSYISKVLCENKNKPQLHCNGNCFLMKKIKQAEQKEKAEEQQFKKNNSTEAFIYTTIALQTPFHKNIKLVFMNPSYNYPEKPNFIFEPPQV